MSWLKNSQIFRGFLVLLTGSIGDLICRIWGLNGTLDKWWTLIFIFPPLSLVSAIFYWLGIIKKGKGKDPIDIFASLLIVLFIIFTFLIELNCESSIFLLNFLYAVIFTFARFYRKGLMCNNSGTSTSPGMEWSFNQAVMVLLGCVVALIILGFLSFIPVLKFVFFLWDIVGWLPGAQLGLLVTISHVFLNMLTNSNESYKKEMCFKKLKFMPFDKGFTDIGDWVVSPFGKLLLLCIISFFMNMFQDMMPF